MTRPRTSRFLALLMLALQAFVWAADTPEPAPAKATTTPPEEAKDSTAAGAARDEPEEFTPSEEISEDFAVSFPVDI